MIDLMQFVAENSQLILLVISILFALVAKYFASQASALGEALRALTDLSQSYLDAVKDGVLSKEELDVLVSKIEEAKKAIQAVIDAFSQPKTIVEKLSMVVFGARDERMQLARIQYGVAVQTMKWKKK